MYHSVGPSRVGRGLPRALQLLCAGAEGVVPRDRRQCCAAWPKRCVLFGSYEETLSTLRYSSRARKIINPAHVNTMDDNPIIKELREEVGPACASLVMTLMGDSNMPPNPNPHPPPQKLFGLNGNRPP